MSFSPPRPVTGMHRFVLSVVGSALVVAACGTTSSRPHSVATTTTTAPVAGRPSGSSTTAGSSRPVAPQPPVAVQLPPPAPLQPYEGSPAGQGQWRPAGRLVDGLPAVYETLLVPPGGIQAAGIAWMDTRLLSARLYSGSVSPGGGPYRYTAPIQPAQAVSLVAAFNGGFKMSAANGGYSTEGRLVDPLVTGAASLVISSDGAVTVGAWNVTVAMSPNVVAVRQNLGLLVSGGVPTPQAMSPDWAAWGATCGVTSCASSVPGVELQWRSGAGVTSDGALVYATGPSLSPVQLADLLVRAGVVSGMELDINPYWTVLATYDPPSPGGPASPSDGMRLLPGTVQGPATFFEPSWARDFITMSARPIAGGG